MPEWNGMEVFKNGMEDSFPCFHTNSILDFAHGIYRKIFTDMDNQKSEVESSRTSLASRTHFEVIGLGLEGQVLGLEASSPRKLACPRVEDSSIF